MASGGEYEEPCYSSVGRTKSNTSLSSKVDSTLPLPSYHVNNAVTPLSRGSGRSEGFRDSYEKSDDNSCLVCIGQAWDYFIQNLGKYSTLSIVLSILGILLVIAIPFAIIMLSQNINLKKEALSGVSKPLNFYEQFLPPRMDTCQDYGFNCNSDPNEFVGIMQRCDGVEDCSDGSDEENCQGCHSGFSCPSKGNKNMVICLRGNKLCDGIVHCDDGSDETLFCSRGNCTENEFYCKSSNTCVPKSYRCDGDKHCLLGEDEENCSSCENGAVLCPSTNKCISKWNICDGVIHCPDRFDESNCECTSCSGNRKVLCKSSNFCITRSEVCNGVPNCPDGEDEENCPGSCSPDPKTTTPNTRSLVKSFFENDFLECNDGKNYIRAYACSGMLPQCEGICNNGCDRELAFTCKNGACISRSKRCNGVPDCTDNSDEDGCDCNPETQYQCQTSSLVRFSKCIEKDLLCDGVRDCPLGDDENNCDKCTNPEAIYCPSTRSCHPSIARCDGISQCPDESDEMGCSCAECNLHPYNMYTCSKSKRCFRRESVCNPYSLCPNASSIDINYCLRSNMPKFLFFNNF
uniref:Terribly reduced optic lobes n=1 Tax=Strongyloides papillosus TaxID=174720 RepID=A0A0N5C793_STREA